MKKVFIAILVLVVAAVVASRLGAFRFNFSGNNLAEFGKSATIAIGENITYPDGLNIAVKEINDSRCKPGVQCVWQGEFSALLVPIHGNFENGSGGIRLGTVNNKSASLKGYTFTLSGATEKSVTIVIDKAAPVTEKAVEGNVSGHVSIGPFCPVERPGVPCPVPPEAYSSREVLVYGPDGVTVKIRGKIDAKGDYKISLAPGNYFVEIYPAGIGPGEKKPVTIKPSVTSTVNFDIDTGIR